MKTAVSPTPWSRRGHFRARCSLICPNGHDHTQRGGPGGAPAEPRG